MPPSSDSSTDPLRKEREATADFVKRLAEANPDAHTALTREDMVKLGKAAWPQSYQHGRTDDEAFNLLAEQAQLAEQAGSTLYDKVRAASFLYLPGEQALMFWCARWADQGFPVVQMGHKYAAALMATAATVDVEDIRPPWKAFLIMVPSKLLSVVEPESGRECEVSYISAHQTLNDEGEYKWTYVAHAEKLTLWRHGVPVAEMLEGDVSDGHDWTSYSFGLDVDDQDQRTYFLIQRLILNVCLAMSHPANVKPLGKNANLSPSQVRESQDPLTRIYQVGQKIKLDCREAIRDYVAGRKRTGPTVQTLVRGHWKSQPHGPKRAFRKRIWIEPYWRGPEDAPILTRPHEL